LFRRPEIKDIEEVSDLNDHQNDQKKPMGGKVIPEREEQTGEKEKYPEDVHGVAAINADAVTAQGEVPKQRATDKEQIPAKELVGNLVEGTHMRRNSRSHATD
jgi:hypothetical protein